MYMISYSNLLLHVYLIFLKLSDNERSCFEWSDTVLSFVLFAHLLDLHSSVETVKRTYWNKHGILFSVKMNGILFSVSLI